MTRWAAFVPLGVLALLAVLFAGYALHHDPHVNPDALVGKPVPPGALQPLDGGAPSPPGRAVRGPMLINFYGSWCAPCVEEAPALMALKAQGAPIVGVAYKDTADKTRIYLQANGNPYAAIFMDPDGRAGVDFGITGVPETFAVSAEGVVLAKHVGPLQPGDAEALLDRIGRGR